jgi:hypothetical protein
MSPMLTQLACRSTCQFVYHGVMGTICRPWKNGVPLLSMSSREPAIKKWLSMECGTNYHIGGFNIVFPLFHCLQTTPSIDPQIIKQIENNTSEILTQQARRSTCQFVYHGVLGAICRPQNNGGPLLSLPH